METRTHLSFTAKIRYTDKIFFLDLSIHLEPIQWLLAQSSGNAWNQDITSNGDVFVNDHWSFVFVSVLLFFN